MVTATAADGAPNSQASVKVKAPTPKAGFRNPNLMIWSQPILLDLDAFPAPTSPLPIPEFPSPPPGLPSRVYSRTPPAKATYDKPSSPMAPMSNSLRPPPRPRSIVSQLTLSNPPSESLPPVPALLHSHDNLYVSSTPTSPTTPTTPSFYTSFPRRNYDSSLSTSLPMNSVRSSSVGRVQSSYKARAPRKISNASGGPGIPAQMEMQRGRFASMSPRLQQTRENTVGSMEEPQSKDMAPKPETNEDERRASAVTELPPRPVGLVATCFYGIESSMRWREGVDPIEKRFASSNGSWRCQDRFAVFFRPGDQIGPDQVVTKTFWSEAWPYPIETILYGTNDSLTPSSGSEHSGQDGHRSEINGDQLSSRLRTGLRLTSSETHLKSAASFPPLSGSKDPRYITSDGVHKVAKVIIPMPDVAIDQMDLVKVPVKVELRIFILESPLRIHASAFLLGRTVAGLAELYM
ncbi:hypothetical protein EDD21DRAFT_197966 [Dissophora ornata]|nr:hypothetical protein BGZ58_010562 [Dissophora ornata]KAI8604705.1 hypothetical protein EDD21DRAFT_197966 [Dissophora ornata]